MIADIGPGGESAFEAYESQVLPLLSRHAGQLERRLRTDDGLNEVHVVSFDSQDAYESYLADEDRQSSRSLLDGHEIVQRVLQVSDV